MTPGPGEPAPAPAAAAEAPAAPRKALVLTPVLIGLNVAVFIAMLVKGVSASNPDSKALLDFGANYGAGVVLDGEWWRPLTSMFVHVGAIHLLVNMYSLWNVGGFVERMLGRSMYAVVYLLTGLAGAFSSIMWRPLEISAGASGAIFGLFGVIIGFTIRAREQLPPQTLASLRTSIVATLGFNLLFALTTPFLDHAAHLGGLSVGVLAGIVATGSALERPGRRASWASQAIVLATVVGLAVLAVTRTKNQPRVSWAHEVKKAATAAEAQQWAEALSHADQALAAREDPTARLMRALALEGLKRRTEALADVDAALPALERDDELKEQYAQALMLRGVLRMAQGQYDAAVVDLRNLAVLVPKDPTTKNNLAWALVRLGRDLDEALALSDAAVKLEPNAAFLGTRCWVHVARGELEEAKADCEAAVAKKSDDVMDQGMLAFIAGDKAKARELWERAAENDETNARDLEPWLAKVRE